MGNQWSVDKTNSLINTPTNNTWQHIAVTRRDSILSIWKNGEEAMQYSFPSNLTHGMLYIGETNNKTQQYNGLLSLFRVTKNISLYNQRFGVSL